MSRHNFDAEIAKQVGVNAAVIYQNIIWWCERNAAKKRNIYEGNAWTYNSVSDFERLFSYLTSKQIRTALAKLEDCGLLISGVFNKDLRDRTKWYAAREGTNAFALLIGLHLPKRADTLAPEGRPLPDSKPDNKHTPKPPEGDFNLFSENPSSEKSNNRDLIEDGFEKFWNVIWPKHTRKTGKKACFKVYQQACTGKHAKSDEVISPDDLNKATLAYIRVEKANNNFQYLKGPLPWLRVPGWEPFMDGTPVPRASGRETYGESVLDRLRGR